MSLPPSPGHHQSPAPGDESRFGSVVDRRVIDRRLIENPGEPNASGLERRRGPGRRRSDSLRAAEEGEMTREQFLFLVAIDRFKKANGVQFPNWSDVLEVVRLLGYRKTMPMEMTLHNAEDWTEPADSPANVRTRRQIERDQAARRPAA